MMRLASLSLMTLATALIVTACASSDRPSVQADEVALPTPLRSLDVSVLATVSELQDAVAAAGSRLDSTDRAYRPSEPESLLFAPRVVMRADLADPDDGFVLVYPAADASEAQERAGDLADYLGSGFGQTNYPADTRFSVAVVGDTVVFSSLSRGRSSDPDRAEGVFDAIAAVGDRVEVRK